MAKLSPIQIIKGAVFFLALLPLVNTATLVLRGDAVDPVALMTHTTGDWTLNFLLLTLSITPLRRFGLPASIIRLRRMLGLYAFFYAVLHFMIYLFLDNNGSLSATIHDAFRRPFVTAGILALLMMTPLAITSNDRSIRALKRNWGRLHRLVYLVAIAGVIHYIWLVKRDMSRPLSYLLVLSGLLLLRLLWSAQRHWLAPRARQKPE